MRFITKHLYSLSQAPGNKVKQPISNDWGPVSRMVNQVTDKVIPLADGFQMADIWNAERKMNHKTIIKMDKSILNNCGNDDFLVSADKGILGNKF